MYFFLNQYCYLPIFHLTKQKWYEVLYYLQHYLLSFHAYIGAFFVNRRSSSYMYFTLNLYIVCYVYFDHVNVYYIHVYVYYIIVYILMKRNFNISYFEDIKSSTSCKILTLVMGDNLVLVSLEIVALKSWCYMNIVNDMQSN